MAVSAASFVLVCLVVVPSSSMIWPFGNTLCKFYGGKCYNTTEKPVGARVCFDNPMRSFLCDKGMSCCVGEPNDPPSQCGRTGVLGRIMNGEEAQRCSHPWQVSFRIVHNPSLPLSLGNSRHECGGTLVDTQWVLTTPECFLYVGKFYETSDFTKDIVVVVGDHDVRIPETNPAEQLRAVNSFYLHPNLTQWTSYKAFNASKHQPGFRREDNSFVLVKLNVPVELNNCVNYICLPDESAAATGSSDCYITGWGFDNTQTFGKTLRQGRVTYYSSSECEARWPGSFPYANVGCADSANSSTSCLADDGGPLACDKDGVFTLRGSSILGYCGARQFAVPDVARVSTWIKQTILNN